MTSVPAPSRKTIQLIIPVFNEIESLGELSSRLAAAFALQKNALFSVLLVDDGSRDGTPQSLADLAEKDSRFGFLRLSRNFGHQAAISAGLDHAETDAVLIMDGDLQDPPELVPDMVRLWMEGKADVIYGVRRTRQEGLFKRACYAGFYRFFKWMTRFPIPVDAGDFGLMSRRVYTVLRGLPERVRFLRGLRFWVGFRQIPLEYDRPARHAGSSKYGFGALYKLATDGLASFSVLPLRIAQFFAFLLGLATLAMLLVFLVWKPQDAPALVMAMNLISCASFAMLFFSVYVLGAYVSRTYQESKGRPLYVVEEFRPPRPPAVP